MKSYQLEISSLNFNSNSTNPLSYRLGFNGMEKDDEIKGVGNSYDYKFRCYDSRLGRFLSIDPITADFPYYSPYQFAGNKPIIAIDLDGLEEYIVITGTPGVVYGVQFLRVPKYTYINRAVKELNQAKSSYETSIKNINKQRKDSKNVATGQVIKGISKKEAKEKMAKAQAKLDQAKVNYQEKIEQINADYSKVKYIRFDPNGTFEGAIFNEGELKETFDAREQVFFSGGGALVDRIDSDANMWAYFINNDPNMKPEIPGQFGYNYFAATKNMNYQTNFASGQWSISDPNDIAFFTLVAEIMNTFTELTFSVEGHTDSQGSESDNMELSSKRVDSVIDFLIKNGVDGTRLTASPKGESKANQSEVKASDRRVSFISTNE